MDKRFPLVQAEVAPLGTAANRCFQTPFGAHLARTASLPPAPLCPPAALRLVVMPLVAANRPPLDERKVVYQSLEGLLLVQLRKFMRDHQIEGVSKNKDRVVELIKEAVADGFVTWIQLLDFINEQEFLKAQNALIYRASHENDPRLNPESILEAISVESQDDLVGANLPIAAPKELTLASIEVSEQTVVATAIGRRSFEIRRPQYESQLTLPRPGLEARVFETVNVRAWVRLEFDAVAGTLQIRAVRLPKALLQRQLEDDFHQLIPWFPLDAFPLLELADALKELHKAEQQDPHEARVQAIGYESASGLRSSVRGSTAEQSITGHGNLDQATAILRERGISDGANLYWLPPNKGGPPGNPLSNEVHTRIRAREGLVTFMARVDREELEHVLQRIRVLAT